MVIYNLSLRPTHTLKKLARFAEQYSNAADLSTLYVEPVENELVSGEAFKFDLGTFLKEGAPSSIHMGLGNDYKYPQTSCHRKSVGTVTYRNWEEEFLFVLAHELRHIDQFWSLSRPKQAEVDAEKHAVGVLAAYRDSV